MDRIPVRHRAGVIGAFVMGLVSVIAVAVGLLLWNPISVPTAGRPSAAGPVGPEVRDALTGVTYRLPVGWTPVDSEEFLFSIGSGAQHEGALIAVGVADESVGIAVPSGSGPQRAAEGLASSFGEFFVPTSGQRQNRVSGPATVDGRTAWKAGYVVVPDGSTADRADVSVTVVEDGERLVYALTIIQPVDSGLRADADATISAIRFD
jgi:hypothetical protein